VPSLGFTVLTWIIPTYLAAQSMMEDSTFTVVEVKRTTTTSLKITVDLLILRALITFSCMGDRRGVVHLGGAVVP
jgi:hypothetical protein